VVLTGGSTPRRAYEELARTVQALDIALTDTVFWFSDERCVAPEDDLSNYRMVKETLFDALEFPPEVRRMAGELGPAEGAEAYERELRAAGEPRFELVLLGLGPDAHMASLFPDQATLQEQSRSAVGVPESGLEPFVPRISLTLPALARTRQAAFLIEGESKAEAVRAAFGPDSEPNPHVPASLFPPLVDELTVLLDEGAASLLPVPD
jgi:6-phosphogluconolactonase